MWRNWQTRRSQKPVMVTSWRFDPSHPHFQNSKGEPVQRLALLLFRIDVYKAQPVRLYPVAVINHQSSSINGLRNILRLLRSLSG